MLVSVTVNCRYICTPTHVFVTRFYFLNLIGKDTFRYRAFAQRVSAMRRDRGRDTR